MYQIAWDGCRDAVFQSLRRRNASAKEYTHPDGLLIWRDGLRHSRDGADDFYESFYNWPLLYLLGDR